MNAPLTWSEQFALQQPQMDTTHQEFVALLADAHAALDGPADALLQRWDTLVEHTVAHFAQEDRWMAATGFASENCHSFQHQAVLQVMVECGRRAREEADFEPLRIAVGELAIWFPQHAQMMDASLAEHLLRVGFDPVTGQVRDTALAGTTPITGCGGGSCST
ncbi:hemerythrin domain-containing protein [Ideonella sp. A 288]|uniref:hemerythrin domain-containing protein n=1 Tax=Ideonella sp. A 288 TaxID=1962181 RepID=UPI000B4B4523|nr:hemerythrin domain-containing protein [Ideonella sp. A 288]